MVARVNAYVWWSIYVKTSSEQELRDAHLPPIAAALESIEFDWDISTEQENPGLFRLVNCQNFEGGSVEGIIVAVLRRAYRLANEWRIWGLEALAAGELEHVQGDCDIRSPPKRPLSLVSMVFEIKRGRILPIQSGGGWQVSDTLHPSK
jgi:hypothetical protein